MEKKDKLSGLIDSFQPIDDTEPSPVKVTLVDATKISLSEGLKAQQELNILIEKQQIEKLKEKPKPDETE